MNDTPDTPIPNPPRRWRRRVRRALLALGAAAGTVLGVSCIHIPADNPDYPATTAEVRAEMARMRANPVGLDRPVLVLSGWRSPPGASWSLARKIRSLTGTDHDRVAYMSYLWANDLDPLGDRVVSFVDEHWATDDPERTTEVDVVAISMGGLVARWAAADRGDGSRRLRIHTLYTLATPHRGAKIAEPFPVEPAAREMTAGSDFLAHLDSEFERADYEIVPYAVLHDWMVGATRAAPPGQDPIWTAGRVGLAHHLVSYEDRIVADIALRLRAEDPLGEPSAPPRD